MKSQLRQKSSAKKTGRLFHILAAALFAAGLLPAPAHADCCAALLKQLSDIRKAVDNLDAANNGGQKLQAEQARREADYQAKTLSELLKQQSKTDAFLDYPTPPDYQCATATLAQADQIREVKGAHAMSTVEGSLAGLYSDNDSGNIVYQRRIFNAACKAGAIGNGDNDRHGKSCDTPADPKLRDRDISLERAILSDPCIPLDPPRLAQEFRRATTLDNYTVSDPNMRESLLAMIVIHRYFRTDQGRFPKNASYENSLGISRAGIMSDSLARRYSSNGALLAALDYHACYAKSYMNGCDKGESEALQYFQLRGITASIDLPPGGYCLSKYQLDIAKNIKDEESQKIFTTGTDALTVIAHSNLEQNILKRKASAAAIDANAALAVNSKNEDIVSLQTPRGPVAENRDLIDAMRKLTRALESKGMQAPQPVSVPPRAKAGAGRAAVVVPPVPASSLDFSARDVLPPIESDYPVLRP
jgi:hypothetical protein